MTLKTQSNTRLVKEEEPTESKCLSCDGLEECQKDSNFDADAIDGCANWEEKKTRTSAVVK